MYNNAVCILNNRLVELFNVILNRRIKNWISDYTNPTSRTRKNFKTPFLFCTWVNVTNGPSDYTWLIPLEVMVSGSRKQVQDSLSQSQRNNMHSILLKYKDGCCYFNTQKANSTDFFETYVMSGIMLCPGEPSRFVKINSCSSLPTPGKSHPVLDAVTKREVAAWTLTHLFIMLENELKVIMKSHSGIKLVSTFPYTMFQ